MGKSSDHIFDELLILKCQAGDNSAMALLVKRWHVRLVRQAFHQTHNTEAAQDIAQDTWHTIIRKINLLRDPSRFRVWAYRIVNNKSVDWIRRQQKDRKITESQQELNAIDTSSSEVEDDIQKLRRALREMPTKERFILNLFYLEGQSVREIAETIGIPVGTVKSRLFKAREHLKTIYKEVSHEKIK
ncbi:MAG: RNA polymerase sigma factor [Bacteroidota bacterium]